ncbi:MAG: beta-ketoacyl-ACP synthase III [Clostridium sp.]
MGNVIKGVGAYLPELRVTNDMLSEIVETNHQWIVERTGIEERRISQGEDTSALALKASLQALERAGVKGSEIDLIIVGTLSPDMIIPTVACMLQKELGAKNAMAFDINAACSGFVYALQIANGLMNTMNFKNALVIGAETLSKTIDWSDRGTCILFGDGAGAVVLEKSEEKGIINGYSKGQGEKWEALTLGGLDLTNPYINDVKTHHKFVKMDGGEVFKFATSVIVESINNVLEGTGISLDEIDYIVPHQANARIINYAAKKLNVDKSKFIMNIDKTANTSAASVPIALNHMYEEGLFKKGQKIILVGFGGGLTYGASLVEI